MDFVTPSAILILTIQTFVQGLNILESSYRAFSECSKDWASPDSPITSLSVTTPSRCALSCMQATCCLSFNICEDHNMSTCHLLPSIKLGICSDLESKSGCVYMEKQNPCQNGGTWNCPVCTCVDGYAGDYCERYIRSCQEGWDLNVRVSTYYMVQPFGSPVAYRIFCNLNSSPTSMVFNRWRFPSCPTNFNKTWGEYKHGWGDFFCGEYFVGLETMHQLMKYERFRLSIYGLLTDVSTTPIYYFYSDFTVKSEMFNYSMDYTTGFSHVGSKVNNGLGTERPRDFCTPDRDCRSCAAQSGGGWWYTSGCEGNPIMSTLADFVWPVDGTDKNLRDIYLGLDHTFYL